MMFASLKNKIREEIGNDVSTVVRNAGSLRSISSKHLSQTGSSSSISDSQISLNDTRESNTISPSLPIQRQDDTSDFRSKNTTELSANNWKRFDIKEDEWRKRLMRQEVEWQRRFDKKDEEWKIRLAEKEREWKKALQKQEKEKLKLEESRQKIEIAKQSLEVALRDAEEYKKKLHAFQEDAEQLEGYQSQEMAKIKHLLLAKEQELDEKSCNLKAALTEIDSLKTEVSRLRRYEDELNNIQDEMESLRHSTQRERAQLSGELAQTKEEVRHLLVKVSVLEQRLALESNDDSTVDDRVADLMRDRTLLERKLEETHLHLSDIKTSWSGTISSLETQVGRLSRQAGEEGLERRRVEEEKQKLEQRVKQLEAEIEVNNVVMANKDAKLLRLAEDIDEMATELKELRACVDDEVEEFNRQIDSSSEEISHLKSELEQSKTKLSDTTTELDHLKFLHDDDKNRYSSLQLQLTRLRENLDIERSRYATLRVEYGREQNEKDSALLRNAQVSQKYEIARQEIRRKESENVDLNMRIEALEKSLEATTTENDKLHEALAEVGKRVTELEEAEHTRQKTEAILQSLKNNASDLENQLSDRTKTIKVLQQRLADMKKTLQRELRVPSSSLHIHSEPLTAVPSLSSAKTITARSSNSQQEDVNFEYLKHVLIKFLTSREYEALHLTRAVATLLHFSPEEEKLLQETLEWKMSWFGTKPNLGFGQTAKAIPPS